MRPLPATVWVLFTAGAVACAATYHVSPEGHDGNSGRAPDQAAVHLPPKRITAPCFVSDGRRLVLPAFGAYTGGLNVLDPAVSGLFENGFVVHLLHRSKLYGFQRDNLVF